MASSVVLTDVQVEYLMQQVDDAGIDKFGYEAAIAKNTALGVVVSGVANPDRLLAESVHAPNGWNSNDTKFKQAVADVVAALVAGWK